MTTFQPVSVGLGLSDYSTDATTPTTPRAPAPPPIKAVSTRPSEDTVQSAPNTPTNANFAGVSGQRPLPTSPFKRSFSPPPPTSTEARPEMPDRADSNPSAASVDSQDIEMGVSDGEGGGSDAESVDADGRPSKKKKGQKFFCTEFPPCKLSFTRSEHLARHIRCVGTCSLRGLDDRHADKMFVENTPERDRSSATALVVFRGSTIYASMPRPCTSTKTFPETRWRRPGRGSTVRSGRIA